MDSLLEFSLSSFKAKINGLEKYLRIKNLFGAHLLSFVYVNLEGIEMPKMSDRLMKILQNDIGTLSYILINCCIITKS